MILYLATYPRSGNSLLQGVLRKNFGFRPLGPKTLGAVNDLSQRLGDPSAAGVRRSLAQGSERDIYLKTHIRPFNPFLDGERIVQLVRHPGASLWSYYRLVTDTLPPPEAHRFRGKPPTLEAVIEGEIGAGSWSAYHEDWMKAGSHNPKNYLVLRYEDITADQAALRADLAAFLSALVRSEQPVAFQHYDRRKSGWDVRGTSSGYEQFYSRRQLELLWETHGETGAKFGYRPPDFDAAAPDEQVRRLKAMLEAAWGHAAKLESQPWRKFRRRALRQVRRIRARLQRSRS